MQLDHNKKLSCCGDEPCHQINEAYIQNSDWLLHEAFCLHSEADIFHPYEKHHSTVKDACQLAQSLNIQNLNTRSSEYQTTSFSLHARSQTIFPGKYMDS